MKYTARNESRMANIAQGKTDLLVHSKMCPYNSYTSKHRGLQNLELEGPKLWRSSEARVLLRA